MMARKKWITTKDIEQGFKRINLTPDILLCEKIAILSASRNMKPTTYVSMLASEAVEREYVKLKPSDLPGQGNLFGKGKKKQTERKRHNADNDTTKTEV